MHLSTRRPAFNRVCILQNWSAISATAMGNNFCTNVCTNGYLFYICIGANCYTGLDAKPEIEK